MRGQSSQQTTATEQAIKARFASVRVQSLQDEFARFCSDTQKIKAEMTAMLAERGLRDLAFAVVAMYPPDRSLNGLSMRQVALKMGGADSADAQFEAARVNPTGELPEPTESL